RVTGRYEGDVLTVRRPRRMLIVERADRELTRCAAVPRHHEDLLRAVIDEPRSVPLVLQDVDRAGWLGPLPLLLVLRLLPPADPRHEGEPAPVRRPGRACHARLEVRQPNRLAAVGRHDVELTLSLLLALRHEREPPAIRRPAGCGVAPRAARE